jgi:hypothetical protein
VRLQSVLGALFERTGSPDDFDAWHAVLGPADRAGAIAEGRERPRSIDDPITGAQLPLALKDDQAAEALFVARHASLRGEQYYRLVPLAKTSERIGRLLGAVVCYRALLVAILARAYARAYGHAAKYLGVLRPLDSAGRRLSPAAYP